MAYKRKSPGPVAEGYTGAITLTSNGVLLGNGTSAVSATAVGTNGQLLCGSTSNAPQFTTLTSSGGTITYTPGAHTLNLEVTTPGGGIATIDGDSGSATGATITFNANSNAGSSVIFSATGATVDLKVSDTNSNTIIGSGAGNGSISGSENICLGSNSGLALTSGSSNVCIGVAAGNAIQDSQQNILIGFESGYLISSGGSNGRNVGIGHSTFTGSGGATGVTTGRYNTALGWLSGSNYTSSESYNILINNPGTASESNVLRIGDGTGTSTQQLNAAYISGINGVNVASSATTVVTMTSGSDQLGTATLTAGTGISITPSANTITISNSAGTFPWTVVTASTQAISINNGYIANYSGTCVMTLPSTVAVGSIVRVSGMNSATGWQIAQNANQYINFGTQVTSTGTGGYLESTNIYDSVELVCNVANLGFIVLSSLGNITVN